MLLSNGRIGVKGPWPRSIMHIKLVAMATGGKNPFHGTLLFIGLITSFKLCKYLLHTADISSRLSVFAKKSWVLFAKKSIILGEGVRNILYLEYT